MTLLRVCFPSKADLSSSPTRRLPCTRGPASCRLRHTWPGPGAAAAARPPAASASAATGGGATEVSLTVTGAQVEQVVLPNGALPQSAACWLHTLAKKIEGTVSSPVAMDMAVQE